MQRASYFSYSNESCAIRIFILQSIQYGVSVGELIPENPFDAWSRGSGNFSDVPYMIGKQFIYTPFYLFALTMYLMVGGPDKASGNIRKTTNICYFMI